MVGGLVSSIDWTEEDGVWTCSLGLLNGGYSRMRLEPGSQLSFQVLRGRYCTGYTRLSGRRGRGGVLDAWRERRRCPQGAEVSRGTQCPSCAANDVVRPCLRCDGSSCLAHPELSRVCWSETYYVYLASFGGETVKAGVSNGRRVVKRWVEQGANAAMRVLVGNGREARRYEGRVQEELGALNHVRSSKKTEIEGRSGMEGDLRILDSFSERVHGSFQEALHFHEGPQVLLPHYRLPRLQVKPLSLRVREGLKVSGEVLGAKGPILYIRVGDLPHTLNLRSLVGRRVESEDGLSTSSQAGLDRFLQRSA